MHEPHVALDDDREQVDEAFDVRAPGQARIELAGPQGAVAGAVEHRLKLVLVEQRAQAAVVFGVAGDDAVAGERPVVFLANGDDLARIARAEIVERVVAGDAGHAGDEQGQRNRFVGAGDHDGIVAERAVRSVAESQSHSAVRIAAARGWRATNAA